jgi:hypothetical protein
MHSERPASHVPEPGTTLNTPSGTPRLGGKLRDPQCAQRRLLGRLDDDGVAGRERGSKLPRAALDAVVGAALDAGAHELTCASRRRRSRARRYVFAFVQGLPKRGPADGEFPQTLMGTRMTARCSASRPPFRRSLNRLGFCLIVR